MVFVMWKIGKIEPLEIEFFFGENVHYTSRYSSHKISVWPGMSNVVSLAVVNSLRFFSVGGNAEYIQIAKFCYISNLFKAGKSIFIWWV